jgi:hypothetical protein
MSHSNDADFEQSQIPDSRYLEFIELLIDKSIKRLKSKSYKPKIQDALRAIRLKHKVFKDSEVERSETHRAEKTFWQEIESMRNEVLSDFDPECDPVDFRMQITRTIIGLKPLVTNGILPIKTITDAFNRKRSQESQSQDPKLKFTYARIGRILSNLGFQKAKTPNGCSAIIWDEKLLPQDADINIHNSLQENELEEK